VKIGHRLFARAVCWPVACLAAACSGGRAAAPPASTAVAHDISLPATIQMISARVLPGATMASLLRAHRVADAEVADLVVAASAVFDLRKVRVDQPYRLAQAIDGALRWFEYEIDGDRLLKVTRPDEGRPPSPLHSYGVAGGFTAEVRPIEKIARRVTVRGEIDGDAPSLFAAIDRTGEATDLSLALADIFASDVDFNTELQDGDRFALVVDKLFRDDEQFGGYGPVGGAELHNDGRVLRAVRFTPGNGPTGYFDERGRSLRKFFLRSPLKFQPVVTSAFSRRRLHPILGEYRAHLGVDYRAPAGAPVIAVADGFVVFAGGSGGSGRMVHLRHANGFESQYLHLSSIAVVRGARVQQGDLIGRVGATGLATAPHLDYRLKRNGAFINPVTAHRAMPPGAPIPTDDMPRFAAVRDRVFSTFTTPSVVPAMR
jgi:murein DD-endopeptidase MepM/ murein hydrolase activator NlpD